MSSKVIWVLNSLDCCSIYSKHIGMRGKSGARSLANISKSKIALYRIAYRIKSNPAPLLQDWEQPAGTANTLVGLVASLQAPRLLLQDSARPCRRRERSRRTRRDPAGVGNAPAASGASCRLRLKVSQPNPAAPSKAKYEACTMIKDTASPIFSWFDIIFNLIAPLGLAFVNRSNGFQASKIRVANKFLEQNKTNNYDEHEIALLLHRDMGTLKAYKQYVCFQRGAALSGNGCIPRRSCCRASSASLARRASSEC